MKHSRGNLIFKLCTADPPDHGTIISVNIHGQSIIKSMHHVVKVKARCLQTNSHTIASSQQQNTFCNCEANLKRFFGGVVQTVKWINKVSCYRCISRRLTFVIRCFNRCSWTTSSCVQPQQQNLHNIVHEQVTNDNIKETCI